MTKQKYIDHILYTDRKLFATINLLSIYDQKLHDNQNRIALNEEKFVIALKERGYDLFESKLMMIASAVDPFLEVYRFNTKSNDLSQQEAYLVLPKSFRPIVNSALGTTIPEDESELGLANIVVQTFFLKDFGLKGFRALPK